jgi:hypothetical protein
MVSPVRFQVSSLLFYTYLQGKRLALAARLHVEKPLFDLSEAVFLEGLDCNGEQFESPPTGGLRLLPHDQSTLVLRDRATYRQRPTLEIHVLPLERQELSGAQPRRHG